MVRKRISNLFVTASDSDVARALGVSRGAIWAYKTGRDSMGEQVMLRVQQVGQLSEVEFTDLMFDLLIESNPPDVTFLRKAKKKIGRILKRGGGEVASILLAAMLVLGVGSPTPAEAFEAHGQGDVRCYVYYVASRRRRWWTWFPLPVPA